MIRFTHIVVSDQGKVPGVSAGSAYMVGTLQECREYQLSTGLRAKTRIELF